MRFAHTVTWLGRIPTSLVAFACVLLGLPSSTAADTLQPYKLDVPGRIQDVRAADINADGRVDLILIIEHDDHKRPVTLVLPSPATPKPGSYFDGVPAPLQHPAAGAVLAGRFGPQVAIRLLGGMGTVDIDLSAAAASARPPATLLGRSAQEPLVFWDGVGDLDGDGLDESWFPAAAGEGAIQVVKSDGTPLCTLSLTARSAGSHSADHAWGRDVTIPKLTPADLDGDGKQELVALVGTKLSAWNPFAASDGKPIQPHLSLELAFLQPDPSLPPETLRTARVQLADINADGKADMLVTFLTGRRDKLGDLKTILFHYPGPFRSAAGTLVAPASRIDTPSIVLHPTFVDLDGDGDLDYVADSIRTKNRLELLARIMGKNPPLTLEAFRFDKAAGSFEKAPAFRTNRVYPSSEAMGNTFGQTVWFGGDFNGDGRRDLMDLSTLRSIEILAGSASDKTSQPISFDTPIANYPMPSKLKADARIVDLNGDGRSDVVVWSDTSLFLLVSKAAK